jgi:hypothetical protein
VQVDPETLTMVVHRLGGKPIHSNAIKLIHMTFDDVGRNDPASENQLFGITSSLVDHTAVNAIVMFRFNQTWTKATGRRVIPLPTQHSHIHRVGVVGKQQGSHRDIRNRSIVVTELASSKLFQMQIEYIDRVAELSLERITMGAKNVDGTPKEVYNYEVVATESGYSV